jgi:hypothetical protein
MEGSATLASVKGADWESGPIVDKSTASFPGVLATAGFRTGVALPSAVGTTEPSPCCGSVSIPEGAPPEGVGGGFSLLSRVPSVSLFRGFCRTISGWERGGCSRRYSALVEKKVSSRFAMLFSILNDRISLSRISC